MSSVLSICGKFIEKESINYTLKSIQSGFKVSTFSIVKRQSLVIDCSLKWNKAPNYDFNWDSSSSGKGNMLCSFTFHWLIWNNDFGIYTSIIKLHGSRWLGIAYQYVWTISCTIRNRQRWFVSQQTKGTLFRICWDTVKLAQNMTWH